MQIFEDYGYISYSTIYEILYEKNLQYLNQDADNNPQYIQNIPSNISTFSRHIYLIFKHIGFAKTLTGVEAEKENGSYLPYNQWFQLLLKYYSSSSPLEECIPSTHKMLFEPLTQAESKQENEPQNINITWLQDVVYLLSAISYRQEAYPLTALDETEILGKSNYEEDATRDIGRLTFDCVLSYGTRLLNKVIC